MKKIILSSFIFILGLGLVGCKKQEQYKQNSKDVYAISAVTGVNNLKASNMLQLSNNQKAIDLNEIKDQLDLMLSYLNEEAFNVTIKESDNEEYSYLMEIAVNNEIYHYYYNETLIKESTKVDDDEEETELKYAIKGIIINNEITYQVLGEKEIEKEYENNKYEEEFSLDLVISKDKHNYTKIKYEYENESSDNELEKEYKYVVFKDSKKVYDMSMDFELENNKPELKLKISEDGKISNFKLKMAKNNNNGKIIYIINDNGQTSKGEINVIVEVENNKITYIYEQ